MDGTAGSDEAAPRRRRRRNERSRKARAERAPSSDPAARAERARGIASFRPQARVFQCAWSKKGKKAPKSQNRPPYAKTPLPDQIGKLALAVGMSKNGLFGAV